jgi:murein DD-endopeptidase MepM/ murein hydrolase activator NlpD
MEESSSLPEPSAEETSSVPQEPVDKPELLLSSDSTAQGSYFVAELLHYSGKEGPLYTDPFGYERQFFAYEDRWLSIVPVKCAAEAGSYVLSVRAGDAFCEAAFSVTETKFAYQYLEVTDEVADETLNNQAASDEYYAVIEPLRETASPEVLWDGTFMNPLGKTPYKVTTSFGLWRDYSTGASERHSGIDMACPAGTPVYASSAGTVLYAGFLQLTGNTVLIEHGLGVKTWYYHMRALYVETGDAVARGEQIGEVGTTGLSTGNHLHFAISVGRVYTDPFGLLGAAPELSF